VGVADEGAEIVEQPLLDGTVEAPAGGPVGVDDALLALGRAEGLVAADGMLPERLEMLLQVVHLDLHPRDDCRT
jgi:hypothetical protein